MIKDLVKVGDKIQIEGKKNPVVIERVIQCTAIAYGLRGAEYTIVSTPYDEIRALRGMETYRAKLIN